MDRLFPGRGLRTAIAERRNRLYGVALSWCGDAMVADDLVQETLMLALQRCHQLRERQKLNAWLHTILHNCWKHHLRRQRNDLEYEDSLSDSGGDPETSSAEVEVVQRVRSAILRLPPGQRETITLVDLAGFSYSEVAEILGIPVGTVMSRLHTSRRQVRKVLRSYQELHQADRPYLRRVK